MNEQGDKGQDQYAKMNKWIYGKDLPYLREILERLPSDVRTKILDDESLQIMESTKDYGPAKFSPFRDSFKNLILIDRDRVMDTVEMFLAFKKEGTESINYRRICFIALIAH